MERVEPPQELRERLMTEVRADAGMRAAMEPSRRTGPARGSRSGRLRRWVTRPAVGLAGAAIVAAGLAGYELRGSDDGIETTPVMREGGITASIERTGDAGTLQMTGLEPLQTGRVYQAWVQHGAEIVPSSLFAARSDGTASAAIPHALEGADAVMVTIEPRGGSTQPGLAAGRQPSPAAVAPRRGRPESATDHLGSAAAWRPVTDTPTGKPACRARIAAARSAPTA